MALAMIATTPPRGHFADARVTLRADGDWDLDVAPPSSATAPRPSTTSSRWRRWARASTVSTCGRATPTPSGTTPVRSGPPGRSWRARRCTSPAGTSRVRSAPSRRGSSGSRPRRGGTAPGRGGRRGRAGPALGRPRGVVAPQRHRPVRRGGDDAAVRSVAFTVQGFRVAVDTVTGLVRVLRSVQAVDAGTVLNPGQLRGQVEGGVAQASVPPSSRRSASTPTGPARRRPCASTTCPASTTSPTPRCCSRTRTTRSARSGRSR